MQTRPLSIVRRAFMVLACTQLLCWSAPALGLTQAELTKLLESARLQTKMPGLRATVLMPDGTEVSAAIGFANKKSKTPLDTEIGMPGGSTGKTFVAALTMLLVEDSVLSLDDLASKYLADTEWFGQLPNAEDIRVRHLLSHTTGIKDYPDTLNFQLSMIGRVIRKGSAKFTSEELIGFVTNRKPLFPAGEGFYYTDPGYLVLGHLLEAASGRNFYELLRERILEPLELDRVRAQDVSVMTDVATGYSGGSSVVKKDGRMKFDPTSEWTGGGLVTTPTMLARFFSALADGRVVQPESLKLMLESGWRGPKQKEWHYGFGVFVDPDGDWFSHAGLWPGYRSHVVHYLDDDLTVAVQTNRDGRVDLGGLIETIADAARTED